MAFPPEAYIIGAQKSGTTSLAHLLDQHPGITVADPKEPDFYTRHWDRGVDWYRRVFDGPEDTVFVDASPSYSMAPLTAAADRADPTAGVPGRIHGLQPAAKFIYILREPAARTYSSYWHNVRAGLEKRPFREAIAAEPGYIHASRYHAQLARYLEHFDFSAFLVLDFRDFQTNPTAVAHRCATFLGLPTHGYELALNRPKNQSFQYNGLGRLVADRLADRHLRRLATMVRTILPPRLHGALKGAVSRGIPPLTPADRHHLETLFQADNEQLAALTGITFTAPPTAPAATGPVAEPATGTALGVGS